MLVPASQYDDTPAMALCIQYRDSSDGLVEYAEVIEPDRVRTFVEGTLTGIDGRDADYLNPLGFVPFVEVQHLKNRSSARRSHLPEGHPGCSMR